MDERGAIHALSTLRPPPDTLSPRTKPTPKPLVSSALARVSPAVVSMIVFFEVPVAAILAMVFDIGNQPTLMIIPGVILILGGCILVVLRTRPENVMVDE